MASWRPIAKACSTLLLKNFLLQTTDHPSYGAIEDLHRLDISWCTEWDVLSEIIIAMEKFPLLVLQFVQGQQDRTKRPSSRSLPVLVQFNVNADD